MIILALDTTRPGGSVAVRDGGETRAEQAGDPAVPHGKALPGLILNVLAGAGLTASDVELWAVAAGPGAFTGLRIGIAAVQGFAFATGRPAVGISALEALAHRALRDADAAARTAAVWMDAARHEVFGAIYEASGPQRLHLAAGPVVGPPSAILTEWDAHLRAGPVIWAGDGAAGHEAVIAERAPGPRSIARPGLLAGTIAELAAAAAAQGQAGAPHALQPLYVRRPDAEIARDLRNAATPSRG